MAVSGDEPIWVCHPEAIMFDSSTKSEWLRLPFPDKHGYAVDNDFFILSNTNDYYKSDSLTIIL